MDGGYVHSLRRARSMADTDNENERDPLLSPSCSCDSRKGHGVWGQSPQPPTNFMFYDSEISDAETNIAATAPNTSLIAPYNNNNNNNRRVHFNKHRLYHKNTTDYYRQNIRRPLFRQSLNNIFNSPSKDRVHYDDLSLSRSENGYHLKLIPTGSIEDKLYFMTTTTHKPAIGATPDPDSNPNLNLNAHHMDQQEEEEENTRPKQSSLVTIFSIWNTMMGTSLLAMPWGMQMSGLPAGIVIAIAMGAICFYTAYCNIDTQKQHGTIGGEVFELTRLLLGRTMERVAKVFSYIVLYGAVMVYWILMTNFMAFNVNYFYGVITGTEAAASNATAVLCPKYGVMESAVLNGTTVGGFFSVLTTPEPQPPNPSVAPTLSSVLYNVINGANATDSNGGGDTDFFHTYWTLKTVPVYLVAIVGPLLFFKSPTFFTKFNSLGTMSVMYLIVYVSVKSWLWGMNMTFTDTTSEHYGVVASSAFGAMSGMLSLSYFIHNIIISLMRNNRHQKNNTRDLSIAYVLVMLTYTFIGATFYMAFPLRKSCIEDNILNNMMVNDPMTLLVRLFLFFQLVTVYPLITFMLRTQIMVQLFGSTYPSIKAITLFNSVILVSCVLVAIFVPKIGMVIRFTGAFSGFIHVFTLPCLLRIASLRKRGELTLISIILNTIVPLLGGVNILLQFFIDDDA